jgi:hypothetical protein
MMRRHLPAWVVVAVAGASSWVLGAAVGAHAADPLFPVALSGSGDSELTAEITDWQNEMFAADQPTDVGYFQRGSSDGRSRLLSGDKEFAVSGVPFTDAELAARPPNSPQIIEAPLAISSLSALVTSPRGGWTTTQITCDPADPRLDPNSDLYDPEACTLHGTYTGPIRIPPENLSALAIGLEPTFQTNNLTLWQHPDMVAAMGPNLDVSAPGNKHTWINRLEGSTANKALMTYAQALGPTAWNLRGQQFPGFVLDANQERFSTRNLVREGESTVIGLVAIYNVDVGCNCIDAGWTGNAMAVSSTEVDQIQADYPKAQFREVEVQNKHGDWVLPTRAALEAAVAAGTGIDSGATVDAPGAYPFTWITRLYTVAGTLDPDKANALAATIRYVATDGQDLVVAKGGAPLTAALRTEALDAADKVVTSNCTQAGYEVVTSGPSAFEPKTPVLQALTAMKHCQLIPPPPTTTTTSTTSTSTTTTTTTVAPTTTEVATTVILASSPPPVQQAQAPATTAPVTTPPPTTTTEPAATTSTAAPTTTTTTIANSTITARPRGRALNTLPMPLPPDGSEGYKKLGTLLLGAATFLAGRRFLMSRRVAR